MPPERIQQMRTPGWRKPPGAKSVTRATRWGNNYKVLDKAEWGYPAFTVVNWRRKVGVPDGAAFVGHASKLEATRFAIILFRMSLVASLNRYSEGGSRGKFYLEPLVGLDLMCFCPADQPCHADVLLILADQYEQGLPLTGYLG